jgi:uncharacterized protein (UPF0332 family)
MDLKRLEAQGSIEKASVSAKQITSNLNRAQRDLRTAKANLTIDEEWAYTIAYHAMLRAGRALIFASGYRPKGREQHKTVVEFCAEILGSQFQHLTTRFNRMRVKRHDFIYEPERPIPKTEAVKSLESAEKFVEEISQRIEKSNIHKGLFD